MEFYSPHHQQQHQQQQEQGTQQQQSGDNNNMSSGAVADADAATVAIAKDMLQLHHGGAHVAANNADHLQQSPALPSSVPDNALGMLKFEQDLLYITETCTIIGRNSSTSHVHFHVAENNLVSRKHFQVLFDADSKEFFVQCLSKNGIFVDDFLQRRNADPLKLPKSCFFRFPSTEIRIIFENYVYALSPAAGLTATGQQHHQQQQQHHQQQLLANNGQGGGNHHHMHGVNTNVIVTADADSAEAHANAHLLPMDNANVIYSPLKISIPKKEQKSPYLSPTGTISAANSCPASPRQGFHQNPAYNNHMANQDLFQTPSTASYNHNEKPPYSYAQLIVQAISAAPDKQLTLSGIYSFIVKHYPYYRKETNKGWQNSIRHNLSLNRYFIKVARSQDEPGKGSFWRIDPDSGAKLIDHSYKKRRQRSSQGFRPSYGMPRSAPVSPSHMDNSRESSPLHDIVLQSAPGSPGMSMENRSTEDLIYSTQHMQQQQQQQQQQPANNSHHQYNGSPYYVSNQNAVISGVGVVGQSHVESGGGGGGGGGNGVGALIALKRNHAMAATAAPVTSAIQMVGGHQQQQQLQQQPQHALQHHPDIVYEEMPTDYSGNMGESGDDECDAAKRPKYMSEVL